MNDLSGSSLIDCLNVCYILTVHQPICVSLLWEEVQQNFLFLFLPPFFVGCFVSKKRCLLFCFLIYRTMRFNLIKPPAFAFVCDAEWLYWLFFICQCDVMLCLRDPIVVVPIHPSSQPASHWTTARSKHNKGIVLLYIDRRTNEWESQRGNLYSLLLVVSGNCRLKILPAGLFFPDLFEPLLSSTFFGCWHSFQSWKEECRSRNRSNHIPRGTNCAKHYVPVYPRSSLCLI